MGAARYLLQKPAGGKSGEIQSPVLQDMGQADMASPDTLADFISWGMKSYPAEHTMLIISDHGDGWNGACEDDSAGTWMHSPQIREALEKAEAETGKKLDIVGMDACLMANAEFANEIKNNADFLIASEQTEGADGWAYTRFLTPEMLKNMQASHLMKVNVEPRDLALQGVRSAETTQQNLPTMSAIDLSKMTPVTDAFDHLGSAILETSVPLSTFSQISQSSQRFYGYTDAVDLANGILNDSSIQDEKVRAAAQEVVDAVGGAVMAEQHSGTYPGAHGMTVEANTWGVPSGYTDLQFAKDSHWTEALAKIAANNNHHQA